MPLHVLTLVDLSPDDVRLARPDLRGAADDLLRGYVRVTCACGWQSAPAARTKHVWVPGWVHRIAMGLGPG